MEAIKILIDKLKAKEVESYKNYKDAQVKYGNNPSTPAKKLVVEKTRNRWIAFSEAHILALEVREKELTEKIENLKQPLNK